MKSTFFDILATTSRHEQGARVVESLMNGIRSSREVREDFVRTLTQAAAGEQSRQLLKPPLKEILSRPASRDAFFDIFNDAILSTKGQTYFRHFNGALEKDQELRALFMDGFKDSVSTTKGQSRFLDLMKAYNLEPTLLQEVEKQTRKSITTSAATPVSPAPDTAVIQRPPALLQEALVHNKASLLQQVNLHVRSEGDQKSMTEKAISSGLAVKLRNDVFGKLPSMDVEKISFNAEKMPVRDPYEVYRESNVSLTRECANCGRKVYKRSEHCPDCKEKGRENSTKTRISYKRRGKSFMAPQDWVEFSSLAMEFLVKERLEHIATIRDLTARIVAPKYKEILAIVKMYT